MRIVGLAVAAIALGACATITKGTTQLVVVNTPSVPGASCTLTSSAIGTQTVVTPASINLQKGNDNISVRCTKECFEDGIGVINSDLEAMTAGNIIVGGVVGIGVDAMTGAMNKYQPEISVALVPNQSCKPPVSARPSRSRA